VLVALVMGAAIAGVGMGDAPAERQAAPSATAVAAATGRIAAGGAATTARGHRLFEDEGCDRCHAIAATSAPGRLGPRLDVIDDDADDIAESIVETSLMTPLARPSPPSPRRPARAPRRPARRRR